MTPEACEAALFQIIEGPELDRKALRAALTRLLRDTRSHVAAWRVATIWDEHGGDPALTRRALKRSETLARRHGRDDSGGFGDFEEEDSWAGRLGQYVGRLLSDDAWVVRLVEQGLFEDEFVDQLYDVIAALRYLPNETAEGAMRGGTALRLQNELFEDPVVELGNVLASMRWRPRRPALRASVLHGALDFAEENVEPGPFAMEVLLRLLAAVRTHARTRLRSGPAATLRAAVLGRVEMITAAILAARPGE